MVAIWLCTLVAAANDGTPSWLHEAVQGLEQDVTVTVAVVKGGEPGMGAIYDLDRGSEAILSGHTFAEGDEAWSESRCRGGSQGCDETPELCEDCDGDGVPECNVDEDGWCEQVLYFEVVDPCTPAGEQAWLLTALDWDWFQSETSLTVEDRGLICESSPPEISCATGSAPAGLVAMLMAGLGLGALGLRRRLGA